MDLRLFSDASTEGWGAHLLELRAEGLWSPAQKALHINSLELLAVDLALKQFLPTVRHSHVIAMTDNTTVVGQITNQGGTHSRALYALTRDLLLWCDANDVLLSARHIPGRLNVLADRLSRRHQVFQTVWSLAPSMAARTRKLWGAPTWIPSPQTRFTSFRSTSLPYRTSAPGGRTRSLSGDELWAYVYPPAPLVSQSLEFIEETRARSAWPPQRGRCNHGSTGCWHGAWTIHASCHSFGHS